MSPKDLIFDFLNLVALILLVGFCIFYFIAGDNFAIFTEFLKAMVPLAFFGILFLIKLKITRSEITRRKNEDNTALVLYLNIFHKLMSDMIVFLTPIILGLLIYSVEGSLNALYIVILALEFLIMFFWQRYIFSKNKES